MSKKEKQFLDLIEAHLPEICFAAVILLTFAIRVTNRHFVSKDAARFLLPWFDEIKAAGGLKALSKQVGDYNALYQFLIALMTYLPFSALTMYKGLSIVFDYVMAAGAGVLVCRLAGFSCIFKGNAGDTERRAAKLFYLSASVVLLLPTVIFNSSMWAQCDSIYVSFILWSLVCLLDEKYHAAFVLLGLAFSFKLQAVFILPFYLMYWFFRKRCSILYLLYVPLMMVVTSLPAVPAGRSLFDTFGVYLNQTATYPVMTARFPNIWMLLGGDYNTLKNGALLATVTVLGLLVFMLQDRKQLFEDPEGLISVAALSVWTALLLLPGMHDRYAYMLDLLLVVLALRKPGRYGVIAAAAVLESTLSYCGYLFGLNYSMQAAALGWLVCYGFFFVKTMKTECLSRES
ncbi:MAG: hypothetical protein Q4B09_00600 [Lachnospiraceae bacterium]|nr:hypothetical protein [Lachnospiraceae bacterium]